MKSGLLRSYVMRLKQRCRLAGMASVCGLSLLLAGCMVGPDYVRPTVDVGTRQLGRAAGTSVLRVSANASAIRSTADHVLAGRVTFENYPYGHGPAAPRIAASLRTSNLDDLHDKSFQDIAFGRGTGL